MILLNFMSVEQPSLVNEKFWKNYCELLSSFFTEWMHKLWNTDRVSILVLGLAKRDNY